MSIIKNSGLDQYGAEPFEQQQFGTVGAEGVNPLGRRGGGMPLPFFTQLAPFGVSVSATRFVLPLAPNPREAAGAVGSLCYSSTPHSGWTVPLRSSISHNTLSLKSRLGLQFA